MKFIKYYFDEGRVWQGYDEEKEFYRIVKRLEENGGKLTYEEHFDLMCNCEEGYDPKSAEIILFDLGRRHPYAFYADRKGRLRLRNKFQHFLFWMREYDRIRIEDLKNSQRKD